MLHLELCVELPLCQQYMIEQLLKLRTLVVVLQSLL